jgi:REP element-mobilizing transposase RayT
MFGVLDRVFVHVIWATWDRAPLLEEIDVRRAVHACIAAKCRDLKCEALAVGGVDDHVHVLVHLHRTVATAVLAQEIKGVSSHLVNRKLGHVSELHWQRGYAAISVSPSGLDRVKSYVLKQVEHHHQGSLIRALEELESDPRERDP